MAGGGRGRTRNVVGGGGGEGGHVHSYNCKVDTVTPNDTAVLLRGGHVTKPANALTKLRILTFYWTITARRYRPLVRIIYANKRLSRLKEFLKIC